MSLARIGIGSNLGDSVKNVERAIGELTTLGALVARSSLYETAPWGDVEQPEFINAAALLETGLAPRDLLAALKAIERNMGRVENRRWGPRVIDLDILAYADLEMRESGLTIPHEGLLERAFALAPLAEIDPEYQAAYERLPAEARAGVRRLGGGLRGGSNGKEL
jgi:2-amino-4-hydroxy-6-hydroxymethyldihydropteridine diphosphokinase